jgi:cbb3-type cytochrome oxidase subunit 3
MLVWISGATTVNYDYNFRCYIPKWMNIIFWYKAKNGTVPLISLVATIELYATVPLLIAMKSLNPKLDLDVLTLYYLLIPWLLIVTPSILICDWYAGYKKKKKNEADEKARVQKKKDNWIANNVKKKK